MAEGRKTGLLAPVFAPVIAATWVLGEMAYMVRATFANLRHFPLDFRLLLNNCYAIGVATIPSLAFIAVFAGFNMSVQAYEVMAKFGAGNYIGMFLVLGIMREMGPMLAAAMMAAKAGTAMASEIATMRVQEEVDALEVMAVNPLVHLVAPRLLAALIMMPVLVVLADFMMIGAGFLAGVIQLNISWGDLFFQFKTVGQLADVWIGMFKGVFYGLVITTSCCYYGYTAGGGPEGVGIATRKAIVGALILLGVLSYFLTQYFYGDAFDVGAI